MTSKGKKPVADSFSSSQPGYISVAGETFFLNLPTDDTNTLEATLTDDSLKGDTAFRRLFLGDKSKEQDPKAPFTAQEQIDLRRVFRAIFGVSTGTPKKGIALPCSKKDLDLLLKSLEIRRKVLIAQINTYDTIATADVHARYMREHLLRLNKLIGDEIPNTLAPCILTDVIDPNALPRMPLDDARMLRLLEIFAYLLAQGKDPLAEFQKTNPQASDILPRMAVKDAPGLKEYEDAYAKANPNKVPDYTETLLKIKKVLQGEIATGDATLDKQFKQAFEAIEVALGIPEPKGSYSDRADVIIKRIAAMEKDKKDDITELMKAKSDLAAKQTEYDALALKEKACQEELIKLKQEKAVLEAQLAKLTAELATANEKGTALEAQLKTANDSIRTLNEALAAATTSKDTAEAALAAANKAKTAAETALLSANEAKTAADAALVAATTTLASLQEEVRLAVEAKNLAEAQLASANTTIDGLNEQLRQARDSEAALRTQNAELETQKAALQQRLDELSAELEEKNVELAELNRQKAQFEAQLNALLEVVPDLTPIRLRELLDSEGLVDTLNEQITELRRQLAACPPADELTRLQALVTELQQRPTQEAYDELQRTVERLNTEIQERNSTIEGLQPFADRIRQLEGLLKEELTLERFADLLRAEESIAGLRARISELEGRPNITQADYETLEGQLRDARARIQELEGRGDISQDDLEKLQNDFERAVDQFEDTLELLKQAQRGLETAKRVIKGLQSQRTELEGLLQAANAKLADCEKVKKQLTDTQLQLEDRKARVGNLERKLKDLETQIQTSSGDAATIQALRDQQAILQAALEKSNADLATAQQEVTRLTNALAAAVAERNARPTRQELDDIASQRNARPTRQELDDMVAQRDGIAAQRNTLIGQRDAMKAERNSAIAARDAAAGERNAVIADREKITVERNAAITAQQALQANVARLEEQIRTQGIYKVVYTRLKEILGIRDEIELPNEGQVDELLGTVQSRIRGAAEPGINKIHLCLLHLLYTLLRRLTSKQGITTDSGLRYTPEKVQAMFGSIQGKTATPISESVLSVFSLTLKTLLQSGVPFRGELEVFKPSQRPIFALFYAQLESLLGNAPFFTSENKACASAFLNQFFVSEYDFTNLYLKTNGHLKVKQEGEDLGLVSVASLFLLVLTSTQQILAANQAQIEAAGCAVPQVDLRPAPVAVPVPQPQPQPAVLPEEARCRPGIVPGTSFRRRTMPGPVKFDQWRANDLEKIRDLFSYLKQIKSSDAPVGPLCRLSIDRLPSEFDTYTKLVNLYSERPLWHTAMLPYKRDAPQVDPASIEPRAGIPSGRGGTRKRKAVNKQKTKKMRKT